MKSAPDVTRMYQSNLIEGANPIELVVLLYDSAIQDTRRALSAMQQGDPERRAAEVGHALMVLQQLQGTLDFERGGSAARQFEQFYNLVRAKLLEAQMRSSPELMQEQIRYLSEVRDCWLQAKRAFQPQPEAATNASDKGEGDRSCGWNA